MLQILSDEQVKFLTDGTIFQIGVAPRRIEIITTADGIQFEETFKRSISIDIDGLKVQIPSLDDMIKNKKASGRTKDLADVEELEALKSSRPIISPGEK